MSEQIAKFRFLNYQIHESSIRISDAESVGKDLQIDIKKSNKEEEKENIYNLFFEITINDKLGSLNIFLNIEGKFEFNKDLTDSEKDSFFNINAPAILFPYVRAYISTLTSLSGINPIILPTINLSNR
ncbi:MAG: protein-export chaperone SecB [Christensenellales bacterium]|jgi:preprotein translocase subunit SecB|nr:protein-export chaperone SecB [Petrimonas sp.]